jgi:hypothetical protein
MFGDDESLPICENLHNFGLIGLADLPDTTNDYDSFLMKLHHASLIIYVISAQRDVQKADFHWLVRLRALPAKLLIVLSKADCVESTTLAELKTSLEAKTARQVIPMATHDKNAVQTVLLPLMIKLVPDLAALLASEVRGLRRKVAQQMVQEAILEWGLRSSSISRTTTEEKSSFIEVQAHLLKRIRGLYGYVASPGDELLHKMIVQHLEAFQHRHWSQSDTKPSQPNFKPLGESILMWFWGYLWIMYYEANIPRCLSWGSRRSSYEFSEKSQED